MLSTNIDQLRDKTLRLKQELQSVYFEREELIRVVLLALLTQQHTLIFGKHGAAKSDLVRAIANSLAAGFFGIQLAKDTTRDEVFGPIKVSKIAEDKLCRAYINFLPGNPIVFLDEIDKANSVILNLLYTAMEERLFMDDGVAQRIPLMSVFGAANNISLFQTDALAPLLDRFLFRIEVNWIQSDTNFLEFIRRKAENDTPIVTTALSLSELNIMQQTVLDIPFPRATQESIGKLKKDLADEQILVSDRRWGSIINLLKAAAFLDGAASVGENHFPVLRHCLWTHQQEKGVVDRLLFNANAGLPAQLQAQYTRAINKADRALQSSNPRSTLGATTTAIADLRSLQQQIENLPRSGNQQQTLNNLINKLAQVEQHRKQLCLV